MYAIVSVGDKQFWVGEGDCVLVPRRQEAEGTEIEITDVLFVGGANGGGPAARVGRPYIEGVRVTAKIESHLRGPKVVSFKFRRRKGSKKTIGHRQPLTKLHIEKILGWNTELQG